MKNETMPPQSRIEEAPGLWEWAIVRLACMAEVGAERKLIKEAVGEERRAYAQWKSVSFQAIQESERPL